MAETNLGFVCVFLLPDCLFVLRVFSVGTLTEWAYLKTSTQRTGHSWFSVRANAVWRIFCLFFCISAELSCCIQRCGNYAETRMQKARPYGRCLLTIVKERRPGNGLQGHSLTQYCAPKKKKKKLYDVFPQKKKITFLIYKPELQGIYFLLLKCNFCFVFFSLVLAFRIGIIVPIMTV